MKQYLLPFLSLSVVSLTASQPKVRVPEAFVLPAAAVQQQETKALVASKKASPRRRNLLNPRRQQAVDNSPTETIVQVVNGQHCFQLTVSRFPKAPPAAIALAYLKSAAHQDDPSLVSPLTPPSLATPISRPTEPTPDNQPAQIVA